MPAHCMADSYNTVYILSFLFLLLLISKVHKGYKANVYVKLNHLVYLIVFKYFYVYFFNIIKSLYELSASFYCRYVDLIHI